MSAAELTDALQELCACGHGRHEHYTVIASAARASACAGCTCPAFFGISPRAGAGAPAQLTGDPDDLLKEMRALLDEVAIFDEADGR